MILSIIAPSSHFGQELSGHDELAVHMRRWPLAAGVQRLALAISGMPSR